MLYIILYCIYTVARNHYYRPRLGLIVLHNFYRTQRMYIYYIQQCSVIFVEIELYLTAYINECNCYTVLQCVSVCVWIYIQRAPLHRILHTQTLLNPENYCYQLLLLYRTSLGGLIITYNDNMIIHQTVQYILLSLYSRVAASVDNNDYYNLCVAIVFSWIFSL